MSFTAPSLDYSTNRAQEQALATLDEAIKQNMSSGARIDIMLHKLRIALFHRDRALMRTQIEQTRQYVLCMRARLPAHARVKHTKQSRIAAGWANLHHPHVRTSTLDAAGPPRASLLVRLSSTHQVHHMPASHVPRARTRRLTESKGDWDRRNRFKVYSAIFAIMNRDFKVASDLLLVRVQ